MGDARPEAEQGWQLGGPRLLALEYFGQLRVALDLVCLLSRRLTRGGGLREPAPMLNWFRQAWRRCVHSAELPQLDPALQEAARKCWEAAFPERFNPPISYRVAEETPVDVVVAVSNLDPGCVEFIRVAKATLVATYVQDDRLKYRPRGLK